MTTKEILDRKGRRFKWTEYNEHGWFESIANMLFPMGMESKMKQLKKMELRKDDVLICTFPKSG